LADEVKTLQELHEKGKLTDQEYADAKAAVLKAQASAPTQGRGTGGEPAQQKKSPDWLTIFVVIVGAVVLLFIILSLQSSGTGPSNSSDASTVQRPAVLVRLTPSPSGSREENLGARDYLDAVAKKSITGVVSGLNALCSEFHFYSDVSKPDYTLVFAVRDIDQIGLGVWDANDKEIGVRGATSIDSAYFTACGLLRQHASGSAKHKQ